MLEEDKIRRHVRIREDIPVRWRMARTGQQGEGTIRNLSVSGVLLEIRDLFTPSRNMEFQLEAMDSREAPLVPHEARTVWGKETETVQKYCFCGLEFVAPTPYNVRAIEKRVEDRLHVMTSAMGIGVMERYFGLQQ